MCSTAASASPTRAYEWRNSRSNCLVSRDTCSQDEPINKRDNEGRLRGRPLKELIHQLSRRPYTPGRTYQMRAIISYPGMSSWGFDLWVVDQNGATAGTLIARQNRSATHTRNQGGITVPAVGDEGVGPPERTLRWSGGLAIRLASSGHRYRTGPVLRRRNGGQSRSQPARRVQLLFEQHRGSECGIPG
jgi:hypothetical protein